MADLTIAELRQLLKHEPETGKLFWRVRDECLFNPSHLSSDTLAKMWNDRYAGKEAFTTLSNYGYRVGSIYKSPYKAHRVCWAMHYGEWPEEIDHINGVRDDNRIENLSNVPHRKNSKNLKIYTSNTSGFCGVNFVKKISKWRSIIRVDGKTVYLGNYHTYEDAVAARIEANERYGFSPRHGF